MSSRKHASIRLLDCAKPIVEAIHLNNVHWYSRSEFWGTFPYFHGLYLFLKLLSTASCATQVKRRCQDDTYIRQGKGCQLDTVSRRLLRLMQSHVTNTLRQCESATDWMYDVHVMCSKMSISSAANN